MQAASAAQVRPARPADLSGVVQLAAEHAAYEEAPVPALDLSSRLHELLFGTSAPRLYCFVAELSPQQIVGYATCTPELSTWKGAEHLHLDCLFLRDGHRGLGLGPQLIEAVHVQARRLGLTEIQWQTPARNTDAIRFYDRLAPHSAYKRRYSQPVG